MYTKNQAHWRYYKNPRGKLVENQNHYYLYGSMMSREEILANLEQMAAQQAALADERARRAEEKLQQMRKVQDRANHLARYVKGGIDINPLPTAVNEPARRVIGFDPRYKAQD